MTADYRWNELDNARGYDAAAEHVHPHYTEIQDVILDCIGRMTQGQGSVIDLGAGSGRLAERILDRWPTTNVCLVDQSTPFLQLAQERLARFGERVSLLSRRLQDPWWEEIPRPVNAIVSMSAIHHLSPNEKQDLYRRCASSLVPGGIFLNGDEVRPENDADYLLECQRWGEHMNQAILAGRIPPPLQNALRGWQRRNIEGFGGPRVSGDDCHETATVQLAYLMQGGFERADVIWQNALWSVLLATMNASP